MRKKTFYVLMAVSMVSIPGFSAQERVVQVQNSVRVGYDDNIYLQENKDGSGYITDILTLTGKFYISGRTDAQLYWQPEVRYRFDGDPETVTYQDLYASLNHAMSQRTYLTLSDRLRYQMKDAQSVAVVASDNENYLENDLNGAVDVAVDELNRVSFGAGYKLRRWDDSSYGNANDFDRYVVDASYLRPLKKDRTTGVLSINYVDQEYERSSRGGYKATSFIGGVDQTFNPNLSGFGRVGATLSSVDNSTGSSDNTTPYLDTGLTYNPSERTSINGSMGYTLYYSENSIYNAQDEYNFRLGVRHDLTANINIATSIAYIYSTYDSDYYDSTGTALDAEDNFLRVNIRGTYKINRNNFIDAGYEYSERSTDSSLLAEYNRNTFDIGWRLRL